MFSYRDTVEGDVRVDVAFTDASLDLQDSQSRFPAVLGELEEACGVRFTRLNQVHGDEVLVVDAPIDEVPSADALVTSRRGLGLMTRVADCAPVLLADADAGVVAAVHAGRQGLVLGIVDRAVETMRDQGAEGLRAWLGPHVCGACYEVPEAMRAEVSVMAPGSWAETSWGTPALDIGAGVVSQLAALGVETVRAGGCTLEDRNLHSYRRDGADAGRLAGLVWLT